LSGIGHISGTRSVRDFCHVDDIEAMLKQLLDAGAEAHQEVTDVGGGPLIATVADADGNIIGLIQSS
jgi:predicted enzyme related to lactoylglutathione lyase